MYSTKPSLIYGFHGCDKDVAIDILNHNRVFNHSHNDYDWLGDGIYFWEHNHQRAFEYACLAMRRKGSHIKKPYVLGAIIELQNCLDLLDQRHLDFVEFAYDQLKQSLENEGKSLPKNKGFGQKDFDFRNRELDCAVIRYARSLAEEEGETFDSVRAAFIEGKRLYEGAGFHRNNHIQIAILNHNCIKRIFIPRDKVTWP